MFSPVHLRENFSVLVSYEMQRNMQGLRGEDHKISRNFLVQALLAKKNSIQRTQDTINSPEKNPSLKERNKSYYVMEQVPHGERVRELVLKHIPAHAPYALTTFLPTDHQLRQDATRSTDARLGEFKSQLPKV